MKTAARRPNAFSARQLLVWLAFTQPCAAMALEQPSVPVTGAVSRAVKHEVQPGQPAYDYAPAAMVDDGLYKAWWCGTGPQGSYDYIYYDTATDFDGTWGSYRTVFSPTQQKYDFDGEHTCDPDVIREDGNYYMYYGGLATPDTPSRRTKIGIASSPDGKSWTRREGGKALIGPKLPQNGDAYGAGQPSVVKVNGMYYMIYTTVWRPTPNGPLTGGEFVIRSRSRLFRTDTQELRNSGWVNIGENSDGTLAVNRERPLFGGDHVYNMAYLANHNVFVLISANSDLRFYDLNFNPVASPIQVSSPNTKEQRGFVRSHLGHLYLADSLRYNVRMMMARWTGSGDPNNIFYYDLGRQTFQLQIAGGQIGPSGYTICAHENQTCPLYAPSKVAYGTAGKFTYQDISATSVSCNNSTFGDPYPGKVKACFYKVK